MIIVLVTGGKGDEFYTVRIRLFRNREEANAFCKEETTHRGEKYWTYAEIINEDQWYEPARYKNY